MGRIPLSADPLTFVAVHFASRGGGASISVSESRAHFREAMPASRLNDRELFELIVMAALRMGLAVEFDDPLPDQDKYGVSPGAAACPPPAIRAAAEPTLSEPQVRG